MKLSTETQNYDFVILGAGIVGLSIAFQLKSHFTNSRILVVEKEAVPGFHTSSRNSGVLHAGIYYKPSSLKARICINGAIRMASWCEQHSLPLLNAGKLVIPTNADEDITLHKLLEYSGQNNCGAYLVSPSQANRIAPHACLPTKTALFSPHTKVVSPSAVITSLHHKLLDLGVSFLFQTSLHSRLDDNLICLRSNNHYLQISFSHLFNCTGAFAVSTANQLGHSTHLKCVPFKGLYWEVDTPIISTRTNLYPTPDLNLPFLGVHLTPSATNPDKFYIGPTATLAFGRENYKLFDSLELSTAYDGLSFVTSQLISNRNSMRNYVARQLPQLLLPNAIKSLATIFPLASKLKFRASNKTGIRPQIIDPSSGDIINDFVCVSDSTTTHLLNTISPAFTASFELADYVLASASLL